MSSGRGPISSRSVSSAGAVPNAGDDAEVELRASPARRAERRPRCAPAVGSVTKRSPPRARRSPRSGPAPRGRSYSEHAPLPQSPPTAAATSCAAASTDEPIHLGRAGHRDDGQVLAGHRDSGPRRARPPRCGRSSRAPLDGRPTATATPRPSTDSPARRCSAAGHHPERRLPRHLGRQRGGQHDPRQCIDIQRKVADQSERLTLRPRVGLRLGGHEPRLHAVGQAGRTQSATSAVASPIRTHTASAARSAGGGAPMNAASNRAASGAEHPKALLQRRPLRPPRHRGAGGEQQPHPQRRGHRGATVLIEHGRGHPAGIRARRAPASAPPKPPVWTRSAAIRAIMARTPSRLPPRPVRPLEIAVGAELANRLLGATEQLQRDVAIAAAVAAVRGHRLSKPLLEDTVDDLLNRRYGGPLRDEVEHLEQDLDERAWALQDQMEPEDARRSRVRRGLPARARRGRGEDGAGEQRENRHHRNRLRGRPRHR